MREILREARSINQIAAQHGILPHQLYQWRDQVLAALPGVFTDDAAQILATQQAAHDAQLQHLRDWLAHHRADLAQIGLLV